MDGVQKRQFNSPPPEAIATCPAAHTA